jgi:hypothetical protein
VEEIETVVVGMGEEMKIRKGKKERKEEMRKNQEKTIWNKKRQSNLKLQQNGKRR